MKKSARILCSFAAVGLAFVARPAAAVHVELQLGRSYMANYGANAAFVEGVFAEHTLGNTGLTWSPDLSVGWINGRDPAHYRLFRNTTRPDSWLGGAGVRLHFANEAAWYRPLFFSFQPAVHGGRTLALSSSYEFISTLGWQEKHWSLQIRHVSNDDLKLPNRGETMALLGLGFDL